MDTDPAAGQIEVRIAELRQLFNQMDPSPFLERDLDPKAEEFIVGWAQEKPANVPITLRVHVDGPNASADEISLLRDAIHQFFRQRSEVSKRELRMLFRRGRISLAIALAFLAMMIFAGDLIATAMGESKFAEIIREGLLIGGWVAMWRP